MITFSYLLDIFKYALAGIGVVLVALYLIKPYIQRSERIQMLELRKATHHQTLPLRLQAYERVVLFIERINPANLLIRVNAPMFGKDELLNLLMTEIRTEYQHNVTQQIYVSSEAWAVVRKIKDDTVNLVTNVIRTLPEDANGLDASKVILSHLGQLEENPYDDAIAVVKRDMEQLF